MLAQSSSTEAGKRLRVKREQRHLSIRDVERFSRRIVEEKKNPAYLVPHNWVSDLENGRSKPRLAKFHSLSLIYGCDITEILSLFGLNISDLDHERGLIALPYTHLSAGAVSRAPIVSPSMKLPDKVLLERTSLVHRMFQGLGEMPLFLAQQAGASDVLYGYVGTEDHTLDPLIRPGAFVQIDPHQNRVVKGQWPSEHDRPVYFVELRDDRYACSWCDHEGSRLLVVPYPQSPVPIRSFRYPQEAEIIGRVTGIAQLIAELHPEVAV
ncbi:MAG TPA: helix-turn-helix transcriptional regulator [Terriglobales bacterium]|nr:helix-turn-helix transcriptional regulator [Terriglobales bacterium]